MSIELQMKVTELQDENSHLRNLVSRSINILSQVKVALEEDDTDEAMRLIDEAISYLIKTIQFFQYQNSKKSSL